MLIFHLLCAVLLLVAGYGFIRWNRAVRQTHHRTPAERSYAKSVLVLSLLVEAFLLESSLMPMNGLGVLTGVAMIIAGAVVCYYDEEIRHEKAHAFVA